MALTRLAHQSIAQHFSARAKNLAIDTTVGNGHDTEFLLRQGFSKVIGFDIQRQAIETTTARLAAAGLTNARLLQLGHENMAGQIDQPVDCFVFNLGYLPKADKDITTLAASSVKALKIATQTLAEEGLISLLCYPGHEAGMIETKAVQQYLHTLPQTWQVQTHQSRNASPTTPILYLLRQTP